MTVRTLLKATDAHFQSLKISPPLITGDPLPRFIPGPLNLQIKHWATLLKGRYNAVSCIQSCLHW